MKYQSLILLTMLLFLTSYLFSAEPIQTQEVILNNYTTQYPRFLNNSKWFVVWSTWEGKQNKYYITQEDTLIGGHIYHTVRYKFIKLPKVLNYPYVTYDTIYTDAFLTKFIREDPENKKVYILSGSLKETVLYDFSLNIGDHMSENTSFMLTNIDSIDTSSGKHKRFTFTNINGIQVYWYEGIGNPADPFVSGSTLSNQYEYTQLFCMYQNDSTIYQNCRLADVNCADFAQMQTALPKVGDTPEMIYPNPTTGKVQVVSGTMPVYSVSISDALGRVVKVVTGSYETPITEFDLSGYSNGIYFCALHTASGSRVYKVLKKE